LVFVLKVFESLNIGKSMVEKYENPNYTTIQLTALVVLRMMIGWHLLYEGLTKLLDPYWSSSGYLLDSSWSWFVMLATNPFLLSVVDFINIWGLIIIGFCLIAGLFSRTSAIAGMILLFLYYISNPPFIGFTATMPMEGNYLIINKTLIEVAALFVLTVFPAGQHLGLDLFVKNLSQSRKIVKAQKK
jgi:thiosulfate dehydrogenase [quinone] large subunit